MPVANCRAAVTIVGIVCAICLAGCVGAHKKGPDASVPAATPAPVADALRVGDRVRITVFNEDRLSGDYEIDAAGAVPLPLAGSVTAAGRSAADLQTDVTGKLRQAYLKDPKVSVDRLSQRPFYILGEVEKPGEYPYRSGLDIWRAMALAGGQTYRASTSKVTIQRAGETEFHDFKLAGDVLVGPGDVVRVPERWF